MRAGCLPYACVSVFVDGAALTEYSTESGDGKSATTFVEAVPGATFSVKLVLGPRFGRANPKDMMNFILYVDGEWVSSNLVHLDQLPISSTNNGAWEQQNGETTHRNLTFAEHPTSDGKAHTSLIKKLESLGEIKVVLKNCRKKAGGPSPGDNGSTFKCIGDDALPEKATKGRSISNHAKLGASVKVATRSYFDVEYPYGQEPLATFKFQYRSRRDLEIEGILERPPSPARPVPLEERDPDDLTAEEAREQLRLLRAREAASNIKQEGVKRERERSVTLGQENGNEENNDDGDDEVTITAAWDRRKRARVSAEGEEVIDLTED